MQTFFIFIYLKNCDFRKKFLLLHLEIINKFI